MDMRKQIGKLASVGERFDRRVAEHMVKVQEKLLFKLHDANDNARTKIASARKEMELIQMGVRT